MSKKSRLTRRPVHDIVNYLQPKQPPSQLHTGSIADYTIVSWCFDRCTVFFQQLAQRSLLLTDVTQGVIQHAVNRFLERIERI